VVGLTLSRPGRCLEKKSLPWRQSKPEFVTVQPSASSLYWLSYPTSVLSTKGNTDQVQTS
jgi:hypothetical protein